jgi:hypothetical protein
MNYTVCNAVAVVCKVDHYLRWRLPQVRHGEVAAATKIQQLKLVECRHILSSTITVCRLNARRICEYERRTTTLHVFRWRLPQNRHGESAAVAKVQHQSSLLDCMRNSLC